MGGVTRGDVSVKAAVDYRPRPVREVAAALVEHTFGLPNLMDVLRGPPGSGSWADMMCELRDSLASEEKAAAPVDMILFCPRCGTQHVDAPEPESGWANPPHKSHLCHACKCVWRPADVPTNGVAKVATRGSADTWIHDSLGAGHSREALAVAIDEAHSALHDFASKPRDTSADGGYILDRAKAALDRVVVPRTHREAWLLGVEKRAQEIEARADRAEPRLDMGDVIRFAQDRYRDARAVGLDMVKLKALLLEAAAWLVVGGRLIAREAAR